jgi:hypothetical protein
VQPQSSLGEGSHDALDFQTALAPAHAAQPDQPLCGKVDPVAFV